jgi:hypothetical protein
LDLLILLPRVNMVVGASRVAAIAIGDELVKTLEIVGDANYRAALRALRDARASRKPTREVRRAITCFGVAYESYKPSIDGWSDWARFTARATLMPTKVGYSYRKACEAALYTAMCYWILAESDLVSRYCGLSQEAFDYYISFCFGTRFRHHVGPWGISETARREDQELRQIRAFMETKQLQPY